MEELHPLVLIICSVMMLFCSDAVGLKGSVGAEQGNTPLGNPDIRIPVVKYEAGHLRPRRNDTEAEEPCREDAEAEEPCGQDDAEKTVQGDAVTGESRTKGPPKEWSRLEQLTPRESLGEGQASPEPPTLRHVPGGAWLLQSRRKDAEAEERCREDAEAEEPCGQDDTEKMVQGDAMTGQSRTKGPPKERSRLEQLTPGESLDEVQASPEPPTLRHVPGGAWLQQRFLFLPLAKIHTYLYDTGGVPLTCPAKREEEEKKEYFTERKKERFKD
ncbi:hypothetical protein NDU88_002932 [Pleurodeles waltl]|uniref:Uncharacterized protein n=1 Tax=Pleurodeles waltl TaxID=8319 RepID=A0AAV7QBA0_PLEWA|nr:hypothetical protein NDU88_002932 [Pleurodeles waltl]